MIWEANSRTRGIDATDNDFDKWNVEMSEAPEMAIENSDKLIYAGNNSFTSEAGKINYGDDDNSDDPSRYYLGKGGGGSTEESKPNQLGSALEKVLKNNKSGTKLSGDDLRKYGASPVASKLFNSVTIVNSSTFNVDWNGVKTWTVEKMPNCYSTFHDGNLHVNPFNINGHSGFHLTGGAIGIKDDGKEYFDLYLVGKKVYTNTKFNIYYPLP